MLTYLVHLALAACLIVMSHGMTSPDPPTTTFRELTECEKGNIIEHSDENKFQQLVQDENGTNIWIIADCQQASLIFNLTMCACVHPPQPPCPYEAVDTSAIEYALALNPSQTFECQSGLVWNQTGCLCDWNPERPMIADVPEVTPCETIFATTFDSVNALKDMTFVPYDANVIGETSGSDGGALFSRQNEAVYVWKVSYTDFGPGFVIDFRFRSLDDRGLRNRLVAIVTNGCWAEETIGINYRAVDRMYDIALAAEFRESRNRTLIEFSCIDSSAVSDGFQWNTVSLSFRQGSISLMVNDVVCYSENFPGAVPDKPKCPLILGHDLKQPPRPGLFGYLDNFSVRRFCPS